MHGIHRGRGFPINVEVGEASCWVFGVLSQQAEIAVLESVHLIIRTRRISRDDDYLQART